MVMKEDAQNFDLAAQDKAVQRGAQNGHAENSGYQASEMDGKGDSPTSVLDSLKRYRSRLITISRRNRELYFKPSSLSFSLSEPFIDWFPRELGQDTAPASSGAGRKLSSAKFAGVRHQDGSADVVLKKELLNLHDHFDLGFAEKAAGESFKDDWLVGDKKLERVRAADNRYAKEFGLTGAWLLGPFLCWRPSANAAPSDMLLSPLFRFPVDLSKSKQHGWQLAVEQSDITCNPSLKYALKVCWDITLPDSFETESLTEAIAQIKNLFAAAGKALELSNQTYLPKLLAERQPVKDEHGEVVRYETVELKKALSQLDQELYSQVTATQFILIDSFWVSHINASRMVLIDDYDRMIADGSGGDVLAALLLGKKHQELELTAPQSLLHDSSPVVSIDGSQQEAVFSARNAQGLVIQGPPGTGKSQTIVNIIADSLLRNEKVLFVSEKRAALDVVFNRLEKAELGDLATVLHSSDLDRSSFYQGFTTLLAQQSGTSANGEGLLNATEQLSKKALEVQSFRDVLAAEHAASGLSLSTLCSLVARYGYKGGERLLGSTLQGVNGKSLAVLAEELAPLERAIKALPHGAEAWLSKKPELIATPQFIKEFKLFSEGMNQALTKAEAAYAELDKAIQLFGGGLEPESMQSILAQVNALMVQQLQLLPSEWQDRVGILTAALQADPMISNTVQAACVGLQQLEKVISCFQPHATVLEVQELAHYFKQKFGFFAFLNSTYRAMKRRGKALLKDGKRSADGGLYKAFVDAHVSRNPVRTILKTLLIPIPAEGDYQAWLSMSENLTLLCRCISAVMPIWQSEQQKTFASLCALLARIDGLRLQSVACDAEVSKVQVCAKSYTTWLSGYAQSDLGGRSFLAHERDVLSKRLASLSTIGSVDAVQVGIQKLSTSIQSESLHGLIADILAPSPWCNWGDLLAGEIVSNWFDEARASNTELRSYNKELFDHLLTQFSELETVQRKEARGAVQHQCRQRRKGLNASEGVALLERESQKKRRLLAPREIMEKGALDEMLSIKPVWLMSPLSISQVLPLVAGMFDVVIFDEASQVPVEDALPSLYRGKRALLVGDRQQMPPTNFFSGAAIDEEDEDQGVESILDLAQLVFPEVRLRWHYRSKKHDLIAFSNSWFYDNSLIVPPSLPCPDDPAIEFEAVADATFTMSAGNRVEALAVVDRLRAVLEQKSFKSVGIIAFGVSQQKVIEEVLEEKIGSDAAFAQLVQEAQDLVVDGADCGLFVKNLESVQGDERDCILLSVGYAPSTVGGALRQQFGPLSQIGGGRRLNVAITRALSKVIVFCSFNPEAVKLEDGAATKYKDTAYFGRYLRFAKAVADNNTTLKHAALRIDNKGAVTAVLTPFAQAVKASCEAKGLSCFTVETGGGYFFDFGYVHNDGERDVAVAVECDGVSIQASPASRDRDVLRLELLRARGWTIERVWPGEFALAAILRTATP
jgi:hypothetical protein